MLNDVIDHLVIRGRKLDLSELVDRDLFDVSHLDRLRDSIVAAKPFPHLVVDDWFNRDLLALINEEFDLYAKPDIEVVRSKHEETYRSRPLARLGPASLLYFGIVNSGWFVSTLSHLTGVRALIPDVGLEGGGLHETRAGGTFGVHRDFDAHLHNGLKQELVFITFLNADWNANEWGGQLELWDGHANSPVRVIDPTAGRTVLMRHGPNSYHGHPAPLTPPSGLTRRSVASYYYSNPEAEWMRAHRNGTMFYEQNAIDRLKRSAQFILPPAFWYFLRSLRRR
jgi:hypothetical protein